MLLHNMFNSFFKNYLCGGHNGIRAPRLRDRYRRTPSDALTAGELQNLHRDRDGYDEPSHKGNGAFRERVTFHLLELFRQHVA